MAAAPQAVEKAEEQPPIEEQGLIVRFIDESREKIDALISIKENQITALKEYKTSLINDAVTGKIKVA